MQIPVTLIGGRESNYILTNSLYSLEISAFQDYQRPIMRPHVFTSFAQQPVPLEKKVLSVLCKPMETNH